MRVTNISEVDLLASSAIDNRSAKIDVGIIVNVGDSYILVIALITVEILCYLFFFTYVDIFL